MEHVLLIDLAKKYGVEKSTLRKYCLKKGLDKKFIWKRPEGMRGQRTIALTIEGAAELESVRVADGYEPLK